MKFLVDLKGLFTMCVVAVILLGAALLFLQSSAEENSYTPRPVVTPTTSHDFSAIPTILDYE